MNSKNRRQEKIKVLIKKALNTSNIDIVDNSSLHTGHGNVKAGDTETHLYIKIRTSEFEGLSKIEMHRMVYKILENEFNNGLHAIELDLAP